MTRYTAVLAVSFLMCGCAKTPSAGPQPVSSPQPTKVENVVRQVIADQFGVKPTDVVMDRPLSDAPLRADELDLVELVMELEEELNISIADEAVEKRAATTHRPSVMQLTPADLVAIASDAEPLSHQREPERSAQLPQP